METMESRETEEGVATLEEERITIRRELDGEKDYDLPSLASESYMGSTGKNRKIYLFPQR